MNLFSGFIFDFIFILFPILVYLFYVAYRNTVDERESKLADTIMIFSVLYISLRCCRGLIDGLPMIMVNSALIFSYVKRNYLANITSLVIVIYNYLFYHDFLLIIITEYLIYYVIYVFTYKKISINYFIVFFSIIKLFFMMLLVYLGGIYTFNSYIGVLLLCFAFCLLMLIIIYLMDEANRILKMHKSVKESIEDKQVRTSLFRITHEIKNPIAVCKGYLDMFDIENLEYSKKYIPIMKEEINKTLLLLEDFLSLNKLKLNKDLLDINLLLEDVLDSYGLYLMEKRIKLVKNISLDEVYINGDYNRLMQVFVNIIKNSVEALRERGVIEVKSVVKGKKVYISFKDNGKGMSKEILDKIKEPFFTTKKNGNGLGVALSFEIIDGHGGQLEYRSKEGEYTLAMITLPIINI